jgi:hypothetical protein
MAEGKLKTVLLEDSVRALIFKNRNPLGLSGWACLENNWDISPAMTDLP